MARKYTSKETKSLIDKHKENLKSLENSFSLPSKFVNQIQDHVHYMYSSGIFSTEVMNSLKEEQSDFQEQFDKLIKLLYLYKRALRQFHTSQAILFNNKSRIVSMIKEASAGSNNITWLFA